MNSLDWVLKHMPKESADALINFTNINPHWRGANWDDCLEVLADTDSHLDVIEPLHQDEELRAMGRLPEAVATTCLYASKAFRESTSEQQLMMVKATIQNNGGYPG